MAMQTGSVRSSDKAPALWPAVALGILGVSIWLVSVSDNTFLLLLPLGIAVLSAKRVRANKWYLLPLVPCALFVLWMALSMTAMWTARG
ncbi:hypothetical protein ACFY5D_17005 [Paeniglutamicibacter sp. NPDC012692]|uniref:hypothetical protein n=1 Tax=Paeniglutamicibacter sp. NPDC012692 TaxID=3364388 RepID=UPI00369BDA84